MMHSIGDLVKVIKTNETKKIIDFESICDIEIYYMSDKTAYPLNEICEFYDVENINRLITENEKQIMGLINFNKYEKNISEWFRTRL